MTEGTKPSFTYINYEVCNYCENLVRVETRDGYKNGCGLVQNESGQYARVTLDGVQIDRMIANGKDAFNGLKGCEQFKASGLPAYPSAKEVLIRANPKATSIPEDPNATETGWEFDMKMNKYPHKVTSFYFRKGRDLLPSIQ